MRLKVFIQDEPQMWRKSIYIASVDIDGRVDAVADPVVLNFTKVDRTAAVQSEPTIKIDQGLGDDFIEALRLALNEQHEASGNELKATKQHLNDMRAIAFSKLNIQRDDLK